MKKLILIISIIASLTACSTTKDIQTGTIKILYWNQAMLDDDYGNLFHSIYPDVEIEVVSFKELMNQSNGSLDELVKRIEEVKPDVIFTRSYEEYLSFSDRDLLEDLDAWIQKEDFDLENLSPQIISLLRENPSKHLYGLAPMYSSTALFFNKDLFNQQKIDYPQDQLSWDDIFLLAARFGDNDENTFGFSYDGSLFELVSMIGRTYGLNIVENSNHSVGIMSDSKKWESILRMVQEAYQTEEVYISGPTAITSEVNPSNRDPFIEGKSAMTLSTTGLIEQYKQSDKKFSLGIVTTPVDPAFRDRSYTIRPNQVFGIYSKSSNKQLAWEFVKFVNSDQVAKIKSTSVTGLYTRVAYSKELFGHSLEPFNKLNHDYRIRYPLDLPSDFKKSLNELVTAEVSKFLSDDQNSHETVIKIQREGENLYTNMKKK